MQIQEMYRVRAIGRRIAPLAALVLVCLSVFDWPLQLSGQRFRWIVGLLVLYVGWRCFWRMPACPGLGNTGRALGLSACLVLTMVALVKVPAIIAGLAFDRGFFRDIEAEEPNGWFEQIVLTRHDRWNMHEYEITRRFHCGPVGVSVPLGTLHAKICPEVIRDDKKVTFTSHYGTTIEVGL